LADYVRQQGARQSYVALHSITVKEHREKDVFVIVYNPAL
jgi:hypothetical protein